MTQITASLRKHYQIIYNGFRNTSFSPERRAETTIADYEAELNADLESIPETERERYASGYEKMFLKWQHSRGNLASSMITGPARFPVARMQKLNNWSDNHYNNFRRFRENALKAIARKQRKAERADIDPIQEQRDKLEQLKKNHETMKAVNAIVRTKKPDAEKFDQIKALGFTDYIKIAELIEGDWMKRKGFPPYALQNNNANIKRVEDRIAQLEKRASGNVAEKTVNGVRCVANVPENRMQLFFPGKPSDAVRNVLKSRGFRWTPSKGCWQSYLNANTKNNVELVLAEVKKTSEQ